ncbi:MAG: beta-N-acetylhexosaminidase [Bryobacteraceae bacterium]
MARTTDGELNRRTFLRTPAAVFAAAMAVEGAQSSTQTGGSPLWREGIGLIPYPQRVELTGDHFTLEDGIDIVISAPSTPGAEFAAGDLAARLKKDFGITARVGTSSGRKSIQLIRGVAPPECGEQGYELTIEKTAIRLRSATDQGLFYATRTLLQVVQRFTAGLRIAGMRLTDWPDIGQRAVHYDTKHHQDKAEYVREFIRTLADYKINMLLWEWEDKFAYPSHPEIGAPGAFTMEEMQALTRYARQYHVQLVPLVQGLGHVSFILKWPQHAHLREIPASNWEFCPRKDGSYKLLLDLWRDAIEATPGSEYIHIGTDETYELGAGVECGCKDRMQAVGRYGLMVDFINRATAPLESLGRKVMSWGGDYRPEEKARPRKGLITFPEPLDVKIAKLSREAGYPVWVYDPNPGIEHLFLPYFYRLGDKGEVPDCLESSRRELTEGALSGLCEGMVCTSWDDSGLHNQMWMMRFVHAAEFSWNGRSPARGEFAARYFKSYYGPQAQDLPELWMLLNKGAYFYMDSFEHKVWHWGDIGKTRLPDLPRGDALEYSPFWNRENRVMVDRSREQVGRMQRALEICRLNLDKGVNRPYDFELLATIADLVAHTAKTYLALSGLETAVAEAHRRHFVSNDSAYASLETAARIIDENIADRARVFGALVQVWEKTRLPKGLSLPGKPFFHQQDRARHFAFRRADMTYLIYDEHRLGLEDYREKLREYMSRYRQWYPAKG